MEEQRNGHMTDAKTTLGNHIKENLCAWLLTLKSLTHVYWYRYSQSSYENRWGP